MDIRFILRGRSGDRGAGRWNARHAGRPQGDITNGTDVRKVFRPIEILAVKDDIGGKVVGGILVDDVRPDLDDLEHLLRINDAGGSVAIQPNGAVEHSRVVDRDKRGRRLRQISRPIEFSPGIIFINSATIRRIVRLGGISRAEAEAASKNGRLEKFEEVGLAWNGGNLVQGHDLRRVRGLRALGVTRSRRKGVIIGP